MQLGGRGEIYKEPLEWFNKTVKILKILSVNLGLFTEGIKICPSSMNQITPVGYCVKCALHRRFSFIVIDLAPPCAGGGSETTEK